MSVYTESVQKLIENLSKLPGIGEKSAERLALFIINMDRQEVKDLASSVWKAKQNANYCRICSNFSEKDVCDICSSPRRDKNVVCVVEQPKDVIALEKSHFFKGVYHVLMGAISPLDGVNPDDLTVDKLLKRLKDDNVKEVIIATNSDTEGEATALYLKKVIAGLDIKVTRIASGIPIGSQLEYADQATLAKALEGRQNF
jgi:recombination protein RecR